MHDPAEATWLRQALRVLADGGVVAVPTESFFALAVDATRSEALDHLFAVKQRDIVKGIGLMVPLTSWRSCVTAVSAPAERLASAFWPGPLSLVLPAAAWLDRRLVVDGSVSMRVPGDSPAAALVSAFCKPLTATSANLTGRPPCRTSSEVTAQLRHAEQLYIVEGECPGGQVSTLVRASEEGWKVLREGAISIETLRSCLG